MDTFWQFSSYSSTHCLLRPHDNVCCAHTASQSARKAPGSFPLRPGSYGNLHTVGISQSGTPGKFPGGSRSYGKQTKAPQFTHTNQQVERGRTGTHTPDNLPYTDTPQLSHSIVKILCSRMKKDQRLQHECPVDMRFMYWQCEKQGQEGLRGRETCAAWRTRNEVREVLWQLQRMAGQNQMRNIKSVCGWRRDNAACGKMMRKPAQA